MNKGFGFTPIFKTGKRMSLIFWTGHNLPTSLSVTFSWKTQLCMKITKNVTPISCEVHLLLSCVPIWDKYMHPRNTVKTSQGFFFFLSNSLPNTKPHLHTGLGQCPLRRLGQCPLRNKILQTTLDVRKVPLEGSSEAAYQVGAPEGRKEGSHGKFTPNQTLMATNLQFRNNGF